MAPISVLLAGETFQATTMVAAGSQVMLKASWANGAAAFISAVRAENIEVTQIPGERCASDFPSDRKTLDQYDVIVISDVDAHSLLVTPQAQAGNVGPNRLELIKGYIADGGGLLMAGGYVGFQGMFGTAKFHDTAVEDCLAVRCMPYSDGLEAPEGIRASVCLGDHPILNGIEGEWPPILGFNKLDLRPDASSRLIAAAAYRNVTWPLLAARDYGAGRSIAWATDIGPHWLSHEFLGWSGYRVLMVNMIRWLARKLPNAPQKP